MSNVKTQAEVDAEIVALEALKDKIVPRSAFVDNNGARLLAVINTLRADLTEDQIYSRYEFDMMLLDSALDARRWRRGEEDKGTERPSEGWPLLKDAKPFKPINPPQTINVTRDYLARSKAKPIKVSKPKAKKKAAPKKVNKAKPRK
jgi:hypothetical protein